MTVSKKNRGKHPLSETHPHRVTELSDIKIPPDAGTWWD